MILLNLEKRLKQRETGAFLSAAESAVSIRLTASFRFVVPRASRQCTGKYYNTSAAAPASPPFARGKGTLSSLAALPVIITTAIAVTALDREGKLHFLCLHSFM